jgi:hypothetical protein
MICEVISFGHFRPRVALAMREGSPPLIFAGQQLKVTREADLSGDIGCAREYAGEIIKTGYDSHTLSLRVKMVLIIAAGFMALWMGAIY